MKHYTWFIWFVWCWRSNTGLWVPTLASCFLVVMHCWIRYDFMDTRWKLVYEERHISSQQKGLSANKHLFYPVSFCKYKLFWDQQKNGKYKHQNSFVQVNFIRARWEFGIGMKLTSFTSSWGKRWQSIFSEVFTLMRILYYMRKSCFGFSARHSRSEIVGA